MDHALRTLFWEATLNCNAGCPFCGSSCGGAPVEDLESSTVLRAFASAAAAYDPAGIMVNVTGGEPLLRRDLFEVMGQVHALGFPWGMVTNGSLITDDVIRRMKETGMQTISVSLDGLYGAHERSRRLPGAFPRIIEAIRKLADAQFLNTIQITTVVTRENIGSLEEMLDFFSALPVDSWRIATVDPIGRCEQQRQLLLGREDLDALFDFFRNHAFHKKPILTTSCSHYLGNMDSLYRGHPFRCEAGKSVASILADGSVFVCPNVPRRQELIQGNIRQDDLVQLWENGFRWFRDGENRRQGRCSSCKAWEQCRGDSLHTYDFETGEPKFCFLRDFGQEPEEKQQPSAAMLRAMKEQIPDLKGIRISYGSSSSATVFVTAEAAEQLYRYFAWGQNTPENACEQMVALAGSMVEGQIWIRELLPVPLADTGAKHAVFPLRLHGRVLEQIAARRKGSDPTGALQFLGYLHSHPGELRAILSEPDLTLHDRLRRQTPGVLISGLVNPQRKELCLYLDSPYSPADVLLFAPGGAVARWQLQEFSQ